MMENDKQIVELKAHTTKLKKRLKLIMKKDSRIRAKNSSMKIKIDEYKEEGNEKWESFKREFNHDMDEIGNSLKDLTKNNTN